MAELSVAELSVAELSVVELRVVELRVVELRVVEPGSCSGSGQILLPLPVAITRPGG